MEEEVKPIEESPEKVVYDFDAAIERALDRRGAAISSVVVLVDDAGRRSEAQSSNENLKTVSELAHSSMNKLKESNGTKGVSPGYAG